MGGCACAIVCDGRFVCSWIREKDGGAIEFEWFVGGGSSRVPG